MTPRATSTRACSTTSPPWSGSTPAACSGRWPAPGRRCVKGCSSPTRPDPAGPARRGGPPAGGRRHRHGRVGIAGDVAAAVAGRTCPVPVVAHRCHRAARLGRLRWTSSRRVLLRQHRGDAVRHRRGACAGVPAWSPSARRGRPLAELARRPAGRCTCRSTPTAGCRGRACGRWPSRSSRSLDARRSRRLRREVLAAAPPTSSTPARRALRPGRSTACDNPAKTLALELAGTLPFFWGASDLATVAATAGALPARRERQAPRRHGAADRGPPQPGRGARRALRRARADWRRRRHLPRPGRRRARAARGSGCVVLRDTEELPEVARPRRCHAPARRAVRRGDQRAAGGRRAPRPPARPAWSPARLRHGLPRPAPGHRPDARSTPIVGAQDRGRPGVSTGGGTRAIVAALAANLGIAVTKFVAFAAHAARRRCWPRRSTRSPTPATRCCC